MLIGARDANAASEVLPPKRGHVQFALAERAAGFGYWRYDIKNGKSTWSPGMFALLGADPGEREPDAEWLLDQILPEDRKKVLAVLERARETKSCFYYRSHTRDPRAAAQIVDTHGEIETGADGEVTAILGVCHDVTQRVIAETEREIAERMYRLIAEEASDVIVMHEDNKLVFTSAAMWRLLKRKPEEFQAGRYLDIVHPDDIDEAKKVLGAPGTGETRTATYRVRHAEGHYVWFEVSTRGVLDETAGQHRREVSVGRDITERKEYEIRLKAAQEHAEAANKAKSLFLANMSHELRTPLNAIIGFADIMKREMFGTLGSERYNDYSGVIHDSGTHLLGLISDILEMAKFESGKIEFRRDDVELSDVVTECAAHMRGDADTRQIALNVHLPREPLSLVADTRAVQQIVSNLLSNAVKFTMPGGTVDISAGPEGDFVRVSVKDDGIGIPTEDLPRLGKPFEQVCADPMLAKNGTGLGLALVGALVQRHGGTLSIHSALGIGTEVTVLLPAMPAVQAAA